ncbi:MAG: hypothetical protein A2728_00210 [Candidatus Spechtbacteria bacterium RIFCSPHIGHO2_01_FULL_38_11]|nr:MAG: hypothetical protein A2728_00210 [Candidatus Spechtbacteria bacterium RIFCSPHIGHO2_01_FULL_38_11]
MPFKSNLNPTQIFFREEAIIMARDKYELEFEKIAEVLHISLQRVQQIYEANKSRYPNYKTNK